MSFAAPEPASVNPRPARADTRLQAIDLLRGAVMIVMALDHVRDYFGSSHFDATDLAKTSAVLFGTRWVTHFCAPVFSFLAGTSASLSMSNGKPRREVAWFLFTRGAWLVVLELTVMHLAWTFSTSYTRPAVLITLWALGAAMMALAALVFLPRPVTLAIALAIVFGHNALDHVPWQSDLWTLMHKPGLITIDKVPLYVGYPLLPWIGVMALGWCFGAVVTLPAERRRRVTLALGLACIALFIAVRALTHYGDPHLRSPEPTLVFAILDFVNCTKYPPSLLYLLMTLGPSLCVLALLDETRVGVNHPVMVFGRVPMFFYVAHIYLIHAVATALFWSHFRAFTLDFDFRHTPEGYGVALPWVYVVWISIVVALYPACRWYAGLKRRNHSAWLSYL